MDFKPKNREWVKNAAIIFLAVLLVLTFFSNTIMNRTLPEVATQYVTDGAITAKVRGTGQVVATGTTAVKAEQTREIRAVMIKAGQEVNAGDVLFVLGEGDSAEIEAAQETLRSLQLSYQRTALSVDTPNYAAEERAIKAAEVDRNNAEAAMNAADAARRNASTTPESEINAAEAKLADAQNTYNELVTRAAVTREAAQKKVDDAYDYLQELLKYSVIPSPVPTEEPDGEEGEASEPTEEPSEPAEESEAIKNARQKLADAQMELDSLTFPEVTAAKTYMDKCEAELNAMLNVGGALEAAYQKAKSDFEEADEKLFELQNQLEQKKTSDSKSQALTYLDLSDLNAQIERAKKKLEELSGGEDNQITAKVSGTVRTVDCTAGDTKAKDEVLCTIEVPDMGYTLSFSVTNDQARRLKPGDSATVSNYYWGNQIVATLSTINVDPKNPQTNKLLTFDLSGDVNAGSDLTISVGQKSANYDVIVPNSAIRSDTNGSFVLVIEAKNSPLGNRYIARRVEVEVLAEDDMNSAVTGDLSRGDYVITTSNAPVKNGDMVRLANST